MSVKQNSRLPDIELAIVGTVAFVIFWQLVTGVFHLVSPLLLPSPVQIAATFPTYPGLLIPALVSTLKAAAIGYVLAFVLAMIVGVALTESDWIYSIFMPLIVGGNSVPKVALAPVIIFYTDVFGKMLVGAWIAFFPMVVNITEGLETIDDEHMKLFDSLDATTWQEYRMIRIPSALTFIFDGLKIGVTLSIIGVITAEFILPTGGIGGLALLALNNLDIVLAFTVVVATGLISVTVFFALFILQDRLVHWKESSLFAE